MGRVRASYCKGAISAMKRHPLSGPLLDRVARARGPIRAATNVGFVGAEHYVALTDAISDVLSQADAQDFWAERLLDAFGRPLMRPLAYGGLRLFGNHAGAVLRMTPQAYALTYRGLGEVEVDCIDARRVRVCIRELPDAFCRPSIVDNFTGHAWAALQFAGQTGAILPDLTSLGSGTLVLDVRWNEAARTAC